MQASDSDSEEEMSEGEELRQAAAAMAVSKKRRAEDQIISLLSDSDDEPMPVSPPASHAAARPSQQAPRGNARYSPTAAKIPTDHDSSVQFNQVFSSNHDNPLVSKLAQNGLPM